MKQRPCPHSLACNTRSGPAISAEEAEDMVHIIGSVLSDAYGSMCKIEGGEDVHGPVVRRLGGD
jgi:hypothetical protein